MSEMRPPLLESPASAFLVFFIQSFILLCLLFSLVYNVTELTFFTMIILSMGIGAYLWSRVSLKHVECKIVLNRTRLFPDERLKIDIRAINSKLLPVLFKVDLFTPAAIIASDTGRWISEETGLLWYQRAVFSRAFFPNRRGVHNLGPPRLRVGDLFGFYFRRTAMEERIEVIVYPRIVNIRPFVFPKRALFGNPGAKSPMEDPVFVFGTRDYQPGRPARGIHWKASARHNRLQEKLCEPAEQEKVLFLLDVDGFEDELAGEGFEKILEVIASLILQMDRCGITVGFATNGHIHGGGPRITPISKNGRQTMAILETLARVKAKSTGPVTDILSKGYMIPWGVSSIYFALNRSNQTQAARVFMNHRNTPIQCVLAQKSSGTDTGAAIHEEKNVYLEDMLVPEDRKK